MNKTVKLLTQIVFYGSIWGIIEATLGHILHYIPATIAGSIMFPIASLILYKAYQKTESKASLFYIATVAATIKAVDFFIPGLSIFKTINPMLSILFEALVVIFVLGMLTSKKPITKYLALPIASISWRTIFIAWMGLQYITTGNLAKYLTSFSLAFNFVIISGLISGLIATLLIYLDTKVEFKFKGIDTKPIFASILLIMAFIITYSL